MWIYTLSSYLTSFTNLVKEYKIFEIVAGVESLFVFLFTGEHMLTLIFTATFFAFMVETAPNPPSHLPHEEEESLSLRV